MTTHTQQVKQTVLGNIKDQPEMLREAFKARNTFINPFVKAFSERPVTSIIFMGSGTSYNVAMMAASYFSRIANVDSQAVYPTEFLHYDAGLSHSPIEPQSILCVGISQSGTSISTCEALEHAKKKGFCTVALTAELDSRITTIADKAIPLLVGLELTGPETKGYTASLFTVYLWAIAIAQETSVLSDKAAEEAVSATSILVENFHTVIDEAEAWYDRNRPGLLHSSRINIQGYGIDYGTMLEGVLKVAEMLRVPTIGNLLEEHVHGPTMALKFDHATVLIGSEEVEFDRMLQIRNAISNVAPGVHVITCREFEGMDERDLVFSIKVDKFLAPLMYASAFHFLAAKGGKDVYIDTNVNPVPIRLGHYPSK